MYLRIYNIVNMYCKFINTKYYLNYYKYIKNNNFSSYEVYEGSLDEKNDLKRGSTIISNKESSTIHAGSKTYEMAKKWYTLADEDEKLCISGITTHKWLEDESIASTHQLLIPCDSDFNAILQKDIIIENRERKLKVTAVINLFYNIIFTLLKFIYIIYRYNYTQLLFQKLIQYQITFT